MSKPFAQHFLELLSHLSLRGLYRLGRLLAPLVAYTPNQVSRQARQNIDLCFAELSKSERRKLVLESIRHSCYAGFELAALWCWPPARVESHITQLDICDSFMQSSRGRIILLPHLGSWETLGIWLGSRIEVMYLYKRRKNKAVDRFVKLARARTGGIPVPTKKAGLRQMLIGLKRGGMLISLLVIPFYVPVLILGSAAVRFSVLGNAPQPQLLLLAGMLSLAVALAPFAIAAGLRISVDAG